MSFINFLCYGHTSPQFEKLNSAHQIRSIGVDYPTPDARLNFDSASPFEKVNSSTYSFPINTDRLITVDLSSFLKINETWEPFLASSKMTRNLSSLLSLGCVVAIYWKHASGRSSFTLFNVIAGIVATALAFVAGTAHIRAHSISSEKINISDTSIINQINDFRNHMLKDGLSFSTIHNELGNRISDFFTENEIIYLFTQKFFELNLDNLGVCKKIYNFTCTRELKTESAEAKIVNAFSEFRKELNFDTMQESVEDLYHSWIRENILPSLRVLFEINTQTSQVDQKMIQLFQKCYADAMEFYMSAEDDDYYVAFGKIFDKIQKESRSLGSMAAVEYIKTTALTDFDTLLHAPGFKTQFRDVVLAVEKEKAEGHNLPKASDWLKSKLPLITDEKVRNIIQGSLDLLN